MGILDRLFGRREEPEEPLRRSAGFERSRRDPGELTDEQAVERYRYMLQTAPPETIEQAHAEAFARLTPEQRQMVLQGLSQTLPEQERTASQYDEDPRSLARMATRAEMRQPGTLERTFGNMGGPGMGIGFGGLMAGSFLSSFAGIFIGSMIAQQFFADSGYDEGFSDGQEAGEGSGEESAGDTSEADAGDSGFDAGVGGFDSGGDSGGDFGGGDFGVGDF